MADELVQYEVDRGVALLTLNRPDHHNAWSHAMEHRYFELLDRARADTGVRVIVLTGAGRSFCPGMDMSALKEEAAGPGPSFAGRRPQTYPLTIPKPIIAAINGACAGIGLVQALVCDLRFAARGAKFTTAFSRRGLVAEHGVSSILPRLIGVGRALDLLLSGRVFDADQAEVLGLVGQVHEPDRLLEATIAYAHDLAGTCSPLSMAVIKAQVYRDLDVGVEQARLQAIELVSRYAGHPDFAEGVASYAERRDPDFGPLPPDFIVPGPVGR